MKKSKKLYMVTVQEDVIGTQMAYFEVEAYDEEDALKNFWRGEEIDTECADLEVESQEAIHAEER